jgi:hypothetical protein
MKGKDQILLGNLYKEVVEEAKKKVSKKPDADKDGVPDWADKSPGEDDNKKKNPFAKKKTKKKGVNPFAKKKVVAESRKDLINLQEAYIKIYHPLDEDFEDQINPSSLERAEEVYGEEPDNGTVEIKKTSTGEDNVSQRHISYDIYHNGVLVTSVPDVIKAQEIKDRIEKHGPDMQEDYEGESPEDFDEEEWGVGFDDSLPPKSEARND